MPEMYAPLERSDTVTSNKSYIVEKYIKCGNKLHILTYIQLALALATLTIGGACFGISKRFVFKYKGNGIGCYYGSAIWVPLPCLLAATIGIAALHKRGTICRRLVFAYFVLCLLCTVPLLISVVLSIVWAAQDALEITYQLWPIGVEEEGRAKLGVTLNICIVIISFAQLLCCIYASILICYSWNCGASPTEPIIVYVPLPAGKPEPKISRIDSPNLNAAKIETKNALAETNGLPKKAKKFTVRSHTVDNDSTTDSKTYDKRKMTVC